MTQHGGRGEKRQINQIKSGYNTYRGWTPISYQNKRYNINQKDEGTQEDRGRDGGTNSILRIKEQETRLILHKRDDDDDDDNDDKKSGNRPLVRTGNRWKNQFFFDRQASVLEGISYVSVCIALLSNKQSSIFNFITQH